MVIWAVPSSGLASVMLCMKVYSGGNVQGYAYVFLSS